jgi:hypothetical protein
MESTVGLFDITQLGSRLIALGFDPGTDRRQDGVIFASDDRITWAHLAEGDPALTSGTALMYGITAGGPGLVAVGMSCEDDEFPCIAGPYPTVWTSADGTAWTRTQLEQGAAGGGVMLDVEVTEHGIVATGSIHEPAPGGGTASSPVAWLSPDGITWSRVWQGATVLDVEVPLGANALALSPDGLIVGVGSAPGEHGEGVAAIWISSNAENWERIDPTSSAFGSTAGYDVIMLDVAVGPNALVAVGSDGGTQAAVWTSTDGRSWARVDTSQQPLESTTSLGAIAAIHGGFMAVGPHGFVDQAERPVTLWTSPDGVSWSRVQVIGAGYAQSMVVTEAGITVAGGTDVDDSFHAAVWTGPAFDPTQPPPDPVSPPTEEPTRIIPGIASLRSGFSCDELATNGYSYAEVAVYWARHGTPADLDPNSNGIPCELAYSALDVADVFGPSEAMAVSISSDLAAKLPFEAAGPAVESGIICSTGTAEFNSNPPPQRPEAYHRWNDTFTCADGSGTFVVGTDVIIQDLYEYGVWNIVFGTGAYTSLEGGGTCITGPIDETSWGPDELTGRVMLDSETEDQPSDV